MADDSWEKMKRRHESLSPSVALTSFWPRKSLSDLLHYKLMRSGSSYNIHCRDDTPLRHQSTKLYMPHMWPWPTCCINTCSTEDGPRIRSCVPSLAMVEVKPGGKLSENTCWRASYRQHWRKTRIKGTKLSYLSYQVSLTPTILSRCMINKNHRKLWDRKAKAVSGTLLSDAR